MKLYTLTCPACAHTFRRILSDPSRPVTCPLCTTPAVLAGETNTPLSRGETAGVRGAQSDQPTPTPARATCSDSPDGEDT